MNPPEPPRPDPAKGGRVYDADEAEWLRAVEEYRRTRKRPFPTLCELLAVARSLGYRKVRPHEGDES